MGIDENGIELTMASLEDRVLLLEKIRESSIQILGAFDALERLLLLRLPTIVHGPHLVTLARLIEIRNCLHKVPKTLRGFMIRVMGVGCHVINLV